MRNRLGLFCPALTSSPGCVLAADGGGEYHYGIKMSNTSYTVNQIAELLGAEVQGQGEVEIHSLAAQDQAGTGQLTFAVDAKRVSSLKSSNAQAAIVPEFSDDLEMSQIKVKNVEAAVAQVLSAMAPVQHQPAAGIHPTAQIDPSANVAANVAIGPFVSVGAGTIIASGVVLHAGVKIASNVEIGADSILCEGVVVRQDCKIGQRVQIGPNSVIGYDGFGYFTENGVHHKIPHVGNVVIEDDVELGACCCVDRAKFSVTRIGKGSKIDNLVQVAHNVEMGQGCIMCGQVGIAGSVKLGNYVVAGGSAVFRDGITVGDQVQCSGCAAVVTDTPSGQIVAGIPARPARDAFRQIQAIERLPDMVKRMKALEARLEKLESPNNDQ